MLCSFVLCLCNVNTFSPFHIKSYIILIRCVKLTELGHFLYLLKSISCGKSNWNKI